MQLSFLVNNVNYNLSNIFLSTSYFPDQRTPAPLQTRTQIHVKSNLVSLKQIRNQGRDRSRHEQLIS